MLKRLLYGLLALTLIVTSCSAMRSKKPRLQDTVWMAETRLFAADAGTITSTYTLSFLSGTSFKLDEKSELPPYPATYMNPDGTVDTLPGFSSKTEQEGTYSFKKNKLTLTFQDGSTMEMQFKGGAFVCEQLHGDEPCLFTLRTVLRAD